MNSAARTLQKPEKITHAFEAGRRGKPDELDSIIAKRFSSHFLSVDPQSRFDLRVSGTWKDGKPTVNVSGEVSRRLLSQDGVKEKLSLVALRTYNAIHREHRTEGDFAVNIALKPQSDVLASNTEAGDSGNPIAVAYRGAPNLLPWERYLAVRIRNLIDLIYQSSGKVPPHLAQAGIGRMHGLRADGKVSVEADYEGTELSGISTIVIAAEHERFLPVDEVREKLNALVLRDLEFLERKYNCSLGKPEITINGKDAWNQGGWQVDDGSREAKPYRDGFGPYGVCEDSFSGEDPSKPSGTGTIVARHIAASVVGNGLAEFARVGLSYRIGRPEVGLNITTQNTGILPQAEIEDSVRAAFDLGIGAAIERYSLRDALTISRIADAADYFHPCSFSWNRVAKLEVGTFA